MREMAAYTGSLLGIGRADHDRNPLRAEVLGAACTARSDRFRMKRGRKVLAVKSAWAWPV